MPPTIDAASRAALDGPQDHDRRLQTDADDVRRLVEHLGDQPATLFGASSGAIVALEALTLHPEVVRTVLPLEPPAVRQLPDGQRWLDFFSEVYDLYRQAGIDRALEKFREHAFTESDRRFMARAMDPRNGEQVRANAVYWFEHELRQYPAVDLDLDALETHAERIMPVAGSESHGHPAYEANRELFVVHGLDDPAVHGTDVHTAQLAAGHAPEASDEHSGATEDHQCTDCPSAVHVVVVCLAVLATVGLAASWGQLRLAAAALVGTAGNLGGAIAVPVPGRCARPVWVRLAVMLLKTRGH